MKQEQNSQIYADLLGDYSSWLGQLIRVAVYGDAAAKKSPPLAPSIQKALAKIFIKGVNAVPVQILDSEKYLLEQMQAMLVTETAPTQEMFQNFWQAYEGLMGLLHRLEKDSLLGDLGIDPVTGLRSSKVMRKDLERELERRSRRGQPFSIAMTRIDGADNCKDNEKVKLAAKNVQKTIRSFDDAYVMGAGEFLISLKHTDVNGAMRFSSRLTEALKMDVDVKFTMSSCVAEPMPGDSIDDLLANTRKDLDHIAGLGAGASGQYEDISPLGRYVMSLKDTK